MHWKSSWRLLAGLIASLVAAPAAADSLTASLSVGKADYKAHEDLAFHLTLRNGGTRDVYVLSWKTPFRGIEDDIFAVDRDGQEVPYVGREYKRPAPATADWVRIPAGGSLSATFDISSAYEMSVTGYYTVSYRIPHAEVRVRRGRALLAEPAAELHSNAVSLHVEGLSPETWTGFEAAREAYEAAAAEEAAALEAAGIPSPYYQNPGFRNCSSSRQSTLRTAMGNAQSYADEAYAFMNNNASSTARYVRWFGTFTSSRRSTVRSHFTSIRSAIRSRTFVLDCGCTSSAYAYVYKNRPYEVYLCNAFWSAPQTGQDSKAGTLVHETSHFRVVADTDDHAYGATACRNLANSNPTRAIDNADSHEYFCELR